MPDPKPSPLGPDLLSVSEEDHVLISLGRMHSTALLTHIPPKLLIKVIVYFFPQKNKPQCTQCGGALSGTLALFDWKCSYYEELFGNG